MAAQLDPLDPADIFQLWCPLPRRVIRWPGPRYQCVLVSLSRHEYAVVCPTLYSIGDTGEHVALGWEPRSRTLVIFPPA